MHAPSVAFAWALWRQHRLGLFIILAYLVLGGALSALLPARLGADAAHGVVGLIFAAFVVLALYLMLIVAVDHDAADLRRRESCFPARLLRLPVSTVLLAGWPLAFGAAGVLLLWPATAYLILRPWLAVLGDAVPLWWPAFLTAAIVAWVQALVWSPFGLPWTRALLVAALWPVATVMTTIALQSRASESTLVTAFAALAGAGWLTAMAGVRVARRGEVPDWQVLLYPLQRLARLIPRRRTLFSKAAAAQFWFEWRLTGNSLPIMTALVLPAALMPLFVGENDVLPVVQTVAWTLIVPVFLGGLFGAQGGGNNPGVTTRIGLGAFVATLPMSTAAMLGAMLKVAAWSTFVSWALLVVLVPVTVMATGNLDVVARAWRHATDGIPDLQVAVASALAAIFLVAWTWKRQVDRLYFGLTGRPWMPMAMVFIQLPLTIGTLVTIGWIIRRTDLHETVLTALPWLLGPLALARLAIAAWALRAAVRQGVLLPRTIAIWLAGWLSLAAFLAGSLVWAVPVHVTPPYVIAFAVFFIMPGVRLTAAPLALACNRHR